MRYVMNNNLHDKALETALNIDSIKNTLDVAINILKEFNYSSISKNSLDNLTGLLRSAQNTAKTTSNLADTLAINLVDDKNNLMIFDYTELIKLINSKFNSLSDFARAIGISNARLISKLSNNEEWVIPEVNKAIEVLGIKENIDKYFFNEISNNYETSEK